MLTNVASALIEGKAAIREVIVLKEEIVEYKGLVTELKVQNLTFRSMIVEKNNQIEALQGQFHVCNDRVDLAQGQIAKLKFKNGMIIVIGSTMIVASVVTGIYFATK